MTVLFYVLAIRLLGAGLFVSSFYWNSWSLWWVGLILILGVTAENKDA